jgi:glycosyltransferase involved in cell wall biosynthesis
MIFLMLAGLPVFLFWWEPQMTRKVVHVIESFSGGSLDVVRALTRIEALPGDELVRHIVVHGCRPDSPANSRQGFSSAVELFPWPYAARAINPWRDILALFSLLTVLRQCGPVDVLHLHSSKAGFVGRMAALLMGLRDDTVYTPHGVANLRQDVGFLQRHLYSLLERVASKLAGVVVACSASEAAALHMTQVPSRLIPNGVPDPGLIVRSFPPRTVINVGRITAQKDPTFFASLAQRCADTGLPYEFVWVGAGEDEAIFSEAPVRLTGWVSPAEVARLLSSADIFLSTSRWEGLSLAVLQAMGTGLPLLLRRCPGNVDLENEGAAQGFDSVEQAYACLASWHVNQLAFTSAGQEARAAFQQHYSEQVMLAAYAGLYESIVYDAAP